MITYRAVLCVCYTMLSIIAILEYTTPSYKVICIGVIQHIEF